MIWKEGKFVLEGDWCGCGGLVVDEIVYFSVYRVLGEYYMLIVFCKYCIGVRCQYVSFGGLVRLASLIISVLVHMSLKW